jgi:GNAT superfamily N-acetyltransferase
VPISFQRDPRLDVRPHVRADIDAVTDLMAAVERSILGVVHIQRADIAALWSTGTFTPELDGVAILEAGRLIAAAQLYGRKADVHVHPGATGRGLGRGLRAWTEARARARGEPRVGQTIPDANRAAVRLLSESGYSPIYSSWVLRIDHPDRPRDPCPPEGVRIRAFRPGDDEQAYRVIEDAFAEWPGRSPTSFDDWRALTIGRPDFVPTSFLIAEHSGLVVGAALLLEDGEIWLDKLAVRRDLRNRGIARALLAAAFVRSFELGYATTGTSTDSRTGSLTLYERLGMTVREHYTHYAIDL